MMFNLLLLLALISLPPHPSEQRRRIRIRLNWFLPQNIKYEHKSFLMHAQEGSCLRLCSVWHGPSGWRRGEPPLLRSSIKGRSGRPFIKNYWDIWTSDIKSLSRAQTSCVWGLNRSHKSTVALLDCRRVCNHRPPQKIINACMNLRPGCRNKSGWGVWGVGHWIFFRGAHFFNLHLSALGTVNDDSVATPGVL